MPWFLKKFMEIIVDVHEVVGNNIERLVYPLPGFTQWQHLAKL